MPRIPTVSGAQAPEGSQAMLEELERVGRVSNFLRTVANSPAALEGYLGLSGSLGRGALPPEVGRRIALAMAEFNGSDYSLSSSVYQARQAAQLGDCEITANRNGASNDPKAHAAVRFAVAVARARGHIGAEQLEALTAAGYDDGQVVEIVHHVALAILSNYLSQVAATEIDFPLVRTRRPAGTDKA